ncbi:glycosyl hydrolase family 95 catalytic domain-containing protein [Longispora urticae]
MADNDYGTDRGPSRRAVLRTSGAAGAALALSGVLPATAHAAAPAASALVPEATATELWYPAPAVESAIISEGLPVGNGRIGALVGGDPARDFLYLADATLWTGGLNATLQGDGQFPYGVNDFGSNTLLAKVYLALPAHPMSAVTGYRRRLDLSNGLVTTAYTYQNVTYRREVYASHPDNVLVVRLTQSGGGGHTGTLTLNGTHGETTTANAGTASFGATLANGLKYGAVAKVVGTGGTVAVNGANVTFTGCTEVLIVLSGGTNYVPDPAKSFQDPAVDPKAVAGTRATAAATAGGATLLTRHVADYQAQYQTMGVDLGTSTAAQRAKDTWARLTDRAVPGAPSDPELEASYLQFGRYLTITGSRTSVPMNLQGLWLDRNNPDWMADYHTDINVQMNYWLADRAGLGGNFTAFADYCVSQLSSWTTQTQALFNDPRNGFRNSTGRIAGWTTAISTNIYGGMGWWWHPAGNAWLCNSLWEHYEYTLDQAYLAKIYPLLKGACQFWESRLLLVDDPAGGTGKVLIADNDWSPEHGPTNAKGITYAQELVWALFAQYQAAASALGRDAAFAQTVAGLQAKLYLPVVSPSTGWLEEWMTPANLGETTHRHLSPLVGLFPGDRITVDNSPTPLITGVRNLLTARGMDSYGWAVAWRALCWARLKDASRAYQLILTAMRPSVNFGNGTARNFLDMYSFGNRATFQIDANLGTPTAMIETLLYSRPGLIELLPALPSGWAAAGRVTGIGARGGFVVDLTWASGQATSATIRSVGGTSTVVRYGTWTQNVTLAPGGSVTVTPPPRLSGDFVLVNRRSGKAIDVPGASQTAGTALIQYTQHGAVNQRWRFADVGGGEYTVTSVSSGLLADVNGGSTADGATIIQWTATGATNQRWRLVDAGGGYVKVVSVKSGKVVGVAGSSTADSAAVVQQTDTGDSSQQWRMLPA